jgi:hypothetical protein
LRGIVKRLRRFATTLFRIKGSYHDEKLAGEFPTCYSTSMKVWLGVIGRACIEFLIILVLVTFAAAAAALVDQPTDVNWSAITHDAAGSALDLIPLAALLTLFLAFFSFETKVKSRGAGWLGLLALGMLLFSLGIVSRRIPFIEDLAARPRGEAGNAASLIDTGKAARVGDETLWIGSFEKGAAIEAIGVDFGSDSPRMVYAPRAEIDPSRQTVEIQGKVYSAARASQRPQDLAPELGLFSGSWIWDRLSAADGEPIWIVLILAGGFLLFAMGFRFLCALSSWPLANALMAAAGLAGLIVLDALLSGHAVSDRLGGLASRLGARIEPRLALAGLEGAIGLVLSAVDLALKPRRRLDE